MSVSDDQPDAPEHDLPEYMLAWQPSGVVAEPNTEFEERRRR